VRLSSLDPRLMPAPLVDHLIAAKRIRPHFHLSLQHAAPRILRAMGRASTPAEYETLLSRLARGRPEAALGADLIAGFPGETDADFAALVDFVEGSPLTYLHVFAYSPRPGTVAAALAHVSNTWASTADTDPQARPGAPAAALARALSPRASAVVESRAGVDSATKAKRAARLRAIGLRKDRMFRKRSEGVEMDGVVIQAAGAGVEVLTANGIAAMIAGPAPIRGQAVRVRIIEAGERKTFAEIKE
jgi:threonylcarbamoyladenosine tRNA methylthiotransferase MtaB